MSGTQTVNNYNNEEEPPRQISDADVAEIKRKIPLDYQITLTFEAITEECINYTNEIYFAMKKMGYVVIADPVGEISTAGVKVKKGDRYFLYIDNQEKKAKLIIMTQI